MQRRRFIQLASGLLVPIASVAQTVHRRFNIANFNLGEIYSDVPSNYPNLSLWFKANSGALDQSLAPCVNGSNLGKWLNATGDGVYGANSTTPMRVPPIYYTNVIGNKPVIRFGATSDSLSLFEAGGGVHTTALATNYTVLCAASITADSYLFGPVLVNQQIRINRSGANILSVYDGDTEGLSTTLPNAASSVRLMVWRRLIPTTYFYQGSTLCGSTGNASLEIDISLMAASWVLGFFNGDLAETCAYTGDIGTTAIASLYNNYFKVKYPTMV